MKKTLLALICLVAGSFFITSCGKDGKTGDCYMKVSKGGMCISSYWDDNSCLPSPSNYDQNYGPCSNRTSDVQQFNYTFYYCSGSGYTGTYSIGWSLADGTDGGFMMKGKDGDDKYFTVTTTSSGLSATVRHEEVNTNNSLSPQTIVSSVDTAKSNIDTYVNCGNYYIHILGKKVWKKPGELVKSKMVN